MKITSMRFLLFLLLLLFQLQPLLAIRKLHSTSVRSNGVTDNMRTEGKEAKTAAVSRVSGGSRGGGSRGGRFGGCGCGKGNSAPFAWAGGTSRPYRKRHSRSTASTRTGVCPPLLFLSILGAIIILLLF
ncbi:hypothetical protein Nepgr_009177 [Nepenthes gracilis]|uniref:Transmembrane protein n=1 Tax=Nepenthes gracilis TaxID=150966 RepID=A0AAD3SAY9_NEPGR|nr:hypothetical protein Nepgr_009177 [Nepenthes gracilis]